MQNFCRKSGTRMVCLQCLETFRNIGVLFVDGFLTGSLMSLRVQWSAYFSQVISVSIAYLKMFLFRKLSSAYRTLQPFSCLWFRACHWHDRCGDVAGRRAVLWGRNGWGKLAWLARGHSAISSPSPTEKPYFQTSLRGYILRAYDVRFQYCSRK